VFPPFPSDPKDPVEVLEQFTFLYQQFEIAFLILNTAEDLLYAVLLDLVEDQDLEGDQEDEVDGRLRHQGLMHPLL
jgi:hypothetical protein